MARVGAASGCPAPGGASSPRLPRAASSLCAMDDFATEILASLPPGTRLDAYASANYDALRASVADFASSLLYLAGFTETDATAPILEVLEPRRFVTLYLGLVLDVLLLTLFALSAILV